MLSNQIIAPKNQILEEYIKHKRKLYYIYTNFNNKGNQIFIRQDKQRGKKRSNWKIDTRIILKRHNAIYTM